MDTGTALELVQLGALMKATSGRPEIVVGLIDGPIERTIVALAEAGTRAISPLIAPACGEPESAACLHGTQVASILAGARGTPAPAICPGCTLLVRPIFSEEQCGPASVPLARPRELAQAILDCVNGGARIINLSAAPTPSSNRHSGEVLDALREAMVRGVLVVAAAGNPVGLGSTTITGHPWVIPVAACDDAGRPLHFSNIAPSIARNGLRAPGLEIATLAPGGGQVPLSGTSAAAPFVAGAAALLWSEWLAVPPAAIRSALLGGSRLRRQSIIPPLLDARSAYLYLQEAFGSRI